MKIGKWLKRHNNQMHSDSKKTDIICGHHHLSSGRSEVVMRIWATVIALLLTASVYAETQDRFVSKLTLPTGETVVVAEGEFEARSIGSFSVRLYEDAVAWNKTTFFTSGLIRLRDGAIDKAILADIDGNRQQEIVIIVRSAGSGGYLSAHAFAIAGDKLIFRAEVEGLPSDTDPVAALRRFTNKQK